MALAKLTMAVACAELVLASLACGSSQTRAAKAASSSESAVATWTSPRLGYKWALSDEWEFYPMHEMVLPPKRLAIDAVAAHKKGTKRPSATLLVWDYTIQDRKTAWGSDPADYEQLEELGLDMMESRDVEHLGTRRITMFGLDGIEVVGMQGNERLSVRMVRRDRRHFEVRCLSAFDQSDWPCESAFRTFMISEPPPRPAAGAPRVFHLREPRFGLEFDAPDDSWLATGPHVGGGGAQLVWMWRQAEREIDVGVMDFRDLPAAPSEERLLENQREFFEKRGNKVVTAAAHLGGEPCHHLKASGSDGWYRDVLLLNRNSINYTVLITQRKRDPKLIARVAKDFRFTLLESERERKEARLAPR